MRSYLVHKSYKEIEVSVVDMDLDKEKALNLALNKAQGQWDKEELAVLLDELSRVPDLNIDTTGFTPIEGISPDSHKLKVLLITHHAEHALVEPFLRASISKIATISLQSHVSWMDLFLSILRHGALCNRDVEYWLTSRIH